MKFVKFRNVTEKESATKEGGVFSKQGLQIATKPTWAFQEVLQKAVPTGGSNLARLGEMGGKLLLLFPRNRRRREEQKGSTLLVSENHFKLVRKIVSVKKI